MRSVLGFIIVMIIRAVSMTFWRLEWKWINPPPPYDLWRNTRVCALMNHTSLYEPIFCPIMTIPFTWRFISKMVAPAADKTFDRPLVGTFWKLMIPGASSITRKRDETWSSFISQVNHDSVTVIAPEGRMKRLNGLDNQGRPMTIRGGIADILDKTHVGYLVFFYSGGLHHVQAPGQLLPRPFKTIKMNLEWVDIPTYKAQFPKEPKAFKAAVVADLQRRLEMNCPT
jgi:hypothetical protein